MLVYCESSVLTFRKLWMPPQKERHFVMAKRVRKDRVATYVGIAKAVAIREIQHGDRLDFLREITSNPLTRREARAIKL